MFDKDRSSGDELVDAIVRDTDCIIKQLKKIAPQESRYFLLQKMSPKKVVIPQKMAVYFLHFEIYFNAETLRAKRDLKTLLTCTKS